jgi:thiol:disulfide interchange protein
MATLLLLAALLLPQGPGSDVSASATVEPASGPAGTAAEVHIVLDIAPGWHVYHPEQSPDLGIPVSAELVGGDLLPAGEFAAISPSKLHIERIGGNPVVYKWMEGKAQFSLPVTFSGSGGSKTEKVKVTWQVCNDRVCLPPETEEIPIRFEITGGNSADSSLASDSQSSVTGGIRPPGEMVEAKGQRVTAHIGFAEAKVMANSTAKLNVNTEVDFGYHIYAPEMAADVPGTPIWVKIKTPGFEAASDKLTTLSEVTPHEEDFGGGMVFKYLWVDGKGKFDLPINVTAAPGLYEVEVETNWQVCNDQICVDGKGFTLMIPVEVVDEAGYAAVELVETASSERNGGSSDPGDGNGGTEKGGTEEGAKGKTETVPAPVDDVNSLRLEAFDETFGEDGAGGAINANAGDVLKKKGLMGLLMAALLAGLASLLTPCVYPMIPITVSYFTKRAEAGKGTALGNATAYGGGIMVTFVGLGMGAAAILGASGANQIASNPWVNLAIGVLFVVLGFSLLGFYEIKPPKFLQSFASKTQANQNSSGYFPVMLMAVAFSVTAFTCTVGFVGGLLALAATSGEWMSSLLAMTVYAFVFAVPFVVLALVPQKLNKLPTAGGWMNAVKVTFGYIELIAALKFLSNADMFENMGLLPRWLIVVLTALFFGLMAAYMFGMYSTKGDYGQKPPRNGKRMAWGTVWAAMAVYVLTGLNGKPFKGDIEGYFPPLEYGAKPGFLMGDEPDEATAPEGSGEHTGDDGHKGLLNLNWHSEWLPAVENAKKRNKLLFIDFTGITCINCRRMEGNIFPEVKETLARLERAHLYVDRILENADLEISVFRSAAQPYYAVVDPNKFLETVDAAKAYDSAEDDDAKGSAKLILERSFKQSILTRVEGYVPDSSLFDKKILKALEEGRNRGFDVDSSDIPEVPAGK